MLSKKQEMMLKLIMELVVLYMKKKKGESFNETEFREKFGKVLKTLKRPTPESLRDLIKSEKCDQVLGEEKGALTKHLGLDEVQEGRLKTEEGLQESIDQRQKENRAEHAADEMVKRLQAQPGTLQKPVGEGQEAYNTTWGAYREKLRSEFMKSEQDLSDPSHFKAVLESAALSNGSNLKGIPKAGEGELEISHGSVLPQLDAHLNKEARAKQMADTLVMELRHGPKQGDLSREDDRWEMFRGQAVKEFMKGEQDLTDPAHFKRGLVALQKEIPGPGKSDKVDIGEEGVNSILTRLKLKKEDSDTLKEKSDLQGENKEKALQEHFLERQKAIEQRVANEQLEGARKFATERAQQMNGAKLTGFSPENFVGNLQAMEKAGLIESMELEGRIGEGAEFKKENIESLKKADFHKNLDGEMNIKFKDGGQMTMKFSPDGPTRVIVDPSDEASIRKAAGALAGSFKDINIELGGEPTLKDANGQKVPGKTPRTVMLDALAEQKENGAQFKEHLKSGKLNKEEKKYLEDQKKQRQQKKEAGVGPSSERSPSTPRSNPG